MENDNLSTAKQKFWKEAFTRTVLMYLEKNNAI